MRILLIDPPFARFTGLVRFYYPIGLAYLGVVLEKAGHEVLIYDVDAAKKRGSLDFSDEYKRLELYRQGINDTNHSVWREIFQVIKDFQPALVGISTMTPKFGSAIKVAEIVKRYDPDCSVVIGGPHATFLSELTMKCRDIDFVVKGEGEISFPKLVEALENNSPLSELSGISFEENGRVYHNPAQEFIDDLDKVPFPARHLLMHPKSYSSEDMSVLMTSRGCPFNCNYCCHMWEKKVRNRSVGNIVEEIKLVKEKYGSTQIEFKDDTFTLHRKRIMELCDRMIDEKLKINWSCSTRASLLDEELIKKMKKSGCNVVKLGIETGSERILKEINKGVTFEQMREAARLLNKYRIFWSGYFMMGLPSETEEDIRKTYQFMKELNPYYAGLGVYSPFPKTELYNLGVKMGLVYNEADIEVNHFFRTNPKDYFFINPDKRMVNIEDKKFNELASEIGGKFHQHNTQWKNLARRGWARRLTYTRSPKILFSDVEKALRWSLGGNK